MVLIPSLIKMQFSKRHLIDRSRVKKFSHVSILLSDESPWAGILEAFSFRFKKRKQIREKEREDEGRVWRKCAPDKFNLS